MVLTQSLDVRRQMRCSIDDFVEEPIRGFDLADMTVQSCFQIAKSEVDCNEPVGLSTGTRHARLERLHGVIEVLSTTYDLMPGLGRRPIRDSTRWQPLDSFGHIVEWHGIVTHGPLTSSSSADGGPTEYSPSPW